MNCKAIKNDYQRFTSIKLGLLNKVQALDKLIDSGNSDLLDIALNNKKIAIDNLSKIDREIKKIEKDFKFLKGKSEV